MRVVIGMRKGNSGFFMTFAASFLAVLEAMVERDELM